MPIAAAPRLRDLMRSSSPVLDTTRYCTPSYHHDVVAVVTAEPKD